MDGRGIDIVAVHLLNGFIRYDRLLFVLVGARQTAGDVETRHWHQVLPYIGGEEEEARRHGKRNQIVFFLFSFLLISLFDFLECQ